MTTGIVRTIPEFQEDLCTRHLPLRDSIFSKSWERFKHVQNDYGQYVYSAAQCARRKRTEYVGNLRRGELRGVIKINKDNCVGCDTCRKVCPVHAISGGLGVVHSIREDACLACGQCLIACPFNAIEQMSFVDEVMKMLDDPNKLVVAHPSPAVRVSVGEEFGAKAGELVTEQFVNALEKAGFTTYDVNQSADQTIMEEGFEFINKIRYWVLGERGPELEEAAKHPFPHFTSCCPAWVKNVETFHPGLLPHLSTAKSPIQMGGPVAKTWAAEYVWKKDPRDIYVVAVTPCTAKIFEAARPEMNAAWHHLVETARSRLTPPLSKTSMLL